MSLLDFLATRMHPDRVHMRSIPHVCHSVEDKVLSEIGILPADQRLIRHSCNHAAELEDSLLLSIGVQPPSGFHTSDLYKSFLIRMLRLLMNTRITIQLGLTGMVSYSKPKESRTAMCRALFSLLSTPWNVFGQFIHRPAFQLQGTVWICICSRSNRSLSRKLFS